MADGGIETGGGFVEDEEFGIGEEGADEGEPTLHAAGERLDHRVAFVIERHVREQFVDARLGASAIEADEAGVELEIFDDGEFFVQGVFLGDDAEALFDGAGVASGIEAEDLKFPGGADDDAIETADEGGFAGAVGTDEANAFAAADLEVQGLERGEVAKTFLHAPSADDVFV